MQGAAFRSRKVGGQAAGLSSQSPTHPHPASYLYKQVAEAGQVMNATLALTQQLGMDKTDLVRAGSAPASVLGCLVGSAVPHPPTHPHRVGATYYSAGRG